MQNYSSYPTPNQLCLASTYCANDDNDIMIVTSNCTNTVEHHVNVMQITPTHVVADTGATSIFVMASAPADNIPMVTKPYTSASPIAKR